MRRVVSRLGRAGWVAPIVASLAVVAIALPVLALAGTPGVGYDVSFPQCNGTGAQALPAGPSMAVVGVNDGHPFSSNPCLTAELKWAGPAAQVYVNADDPGPHVRVVRGRLVQLPTRWPTTAQRSPKRCGLTRPRGTTLTTACAFDYGWNAARDAHARVGASLRALANANPGSPSLPVTPLRWWLDVESANAWLRSTALNTASINGFLAYLQAVHAASVGIYSNRYDAHTIFTSGSRFVPGTERWLATGSGTLTGGLSYCAYPGFVGDTVSMVQYWPSSPQLDADAPCVGYLTGPLDPAAGVTATGLGVTLSHPAPTGGVALTVSSSSSGGRFAGPGQAVPAATLALSIPAGATKSAGFAYSDTRVGTATITAMGALGRIANFATVTPGPVAGIAIAPSQLTLPVGAARTLSATGYDRFGNRARHAVAPTWSVSPGVAATLASGPTPSVTLRGMAAEPITVTATLGSLIAHRTYAVVVPAGGTPGTVTGSARLTAGVASGPQRVRIWTPAGPAGSVWTLQPASANGLVSLSSNGPWVRSLAETIVPGGIFSPVFYLRETIAGTTRIVATQAGLTIVRLETVIAAAPVHLSIAPSSLTLPIHGTVVLQARATDRFGNVFAAGVGWSIAPRGAIGVTAHHSTLRVRGLSAGTVRVTARLGQLTARARIAVP
jgi:hypothetical protein